MTSKHIQMCISLAKISLEYLDTLSNHLKPLCLFAGLLYSLLLYMFVPVHSIRLVLRVWLIVEWECAEKHPNRSQR